MIEWLGDQVTPKGYKYTNALITNISCVCICSCNDSSNSRWNNSSNGVPYSSGNTTVIE